VRERRHRADEREQRQDREHRRREHVRRRALVPARRVVRVAASEEREERDAGGEHGRHADV
jgi:hypothetical protein